MRLTEMCSFVCLPVISCLPFRWGEGKKHQLAIVKSILEFQKAMTLKFPPSSLSVTPYHLNFMGQMLG